MTPALTFVHAFARGDLDEIEGLLAEAFSFRGPLLVAKSRDAFVQSLREDPPTRAIVTLRRHVVSGNEEAVLYDLIVPGRSILLVAQWSREEAGRLVEMDLVFDTSGVGQSKSEHDMK